ncbi:MAG: hypothetical protein IKN07_09815, partial [Lachnospiraceae bacterium]|nr:hypothetical protein [Lachnospiraceae bacterium]
MPQLCLYVYEKSDFIFFGGKEFGVKSYFSYRSRMEKAENSKNIVRKGKLNMVKRFLLDTNIILNDPKAMINGFSDNIVIISGTTLQELDKKKT